MFNIYLARALCSFYQSGKLLGWKEKHLKSLTALIYPQKLSPFNLWAGIPAKKRLHSSCEYGHGKMTVLPENGGVEQRTLWLLKCTQGLMSFLSSFTWIVPLIFCWIIPQIFCCTPINPLKQEHCWDMPGKNRITSSPQRGWAGTEESRCLIIKSIHQAGKGVRTLRSIHPNSRAAIREMLQGLGRDKKMGITAGDGGKSMQGPQFCPQFFLPAGLLTCLGGSSAEQPERIRRALRKGNFGEFRWTPSCSKEKVGGGRALCRFSWKEEEFHEVPSALPLGLSLSQQRDEGAGIQQQLAGISSIHSQAFPGLVVHPEFCISGMILEAHLQEQGITWESQLHQKPDINF